MRTIIAVRNLKEKGKTPTLKRLRGLLDEKIEVISENIDEHGDIFLIAKVKNTDIIIGVGSHGDIELRLKRDIEEMVDNGCSIIICAVRCNLKLGCSREEMIEKFAQEHNYQVIWLSNYTTDESDITHEELNSIQAKNLLYLIDCLVDKQIKQ